MGETEQLKTKYERIHLKNPSQSRELESFRNEQGRNGKDECVRNNEMHVVLAEKNQELYKICRRISRTYISRMNNQKENPNNVSFREKGWNGVFDPITSWMHNKNDCYSILSFSSSHKWKYGIVT